MNASIYRKMMSLDLKFVGLLQDQPLVDLPGGNPHWYFPIIVLQKGFRRLHSSLKTILYATLARDMPR